MDSKHKISVFTAVIMNINMMVGVGAFFGPQLMAKKAGAASFLGWPLVALIFLPIVLSVATIAKNFPGAGSFYSYSKSLINKPAGFISGWLFFLGYAGVAALQTTCVRKIILQYVTISPIVFNLLFIAIIASLSLLSMRMISYIQNIGTFFKLLPLLFVLAIFWMYWDPSLQITLPMFKALPATLPIALFGFWGFESCCTLSHLIKGGANSVSKAILFAFAFTVVIYTVFHFGLLHIMGVSNLINYGTEHLGQFLRLSNTQVTSAINITITLAIIFAYINAIFSLFVANTATLHAMASEKLLPFSKQLSIQNQNLRPVGATITLFVFVTLLVSVTSNEFALTSISNLGVLGAFLLTLIALLILQTKNKSFTRMPITFLAFASWITLTFFSWQSIGHDTYARLLMVLPLASALLVGIVLFVITHKNSLRQRRS